METPHKDLSHSKDGHRTYSIRQLSKEFDVTARALRFYEDKGLISPERKGQTRLYSPRDRARLQLILRGKRLGFSLVEIHEILDLYTPKDHGAAQMRATLHIPRPDRKPETPARGYRCGDQGHGRGMRLA